MNIGNKHLNPQLRLKNYSTERGKGKEELYTNPESSIKIGNKNPRPHLCVTSYTHSPKSVELKFKIKFTKNLIQSSTAGSTARTTSRKSIRTTSAATPTRPTRRTRTERQLTINGLYLSWSSTLSSSFYPGNFGNLWREEL